MSTFGIPKSGPVDLIDVRTWGTAPSDITVVDGRIAAIAPHREDGAPSASRGDEIAGRGRVLLPSFADVHVHLDSTRLGLPFRPHSAEPGVWNMVLNDRAHWRSAERSVTDRAAYTLGLMIARGTTRVRSYAQVDVDCGLDRLDAVLTARETHAERCSVQVIAFPQAGLLREPGTIEVFEAALRTGVDVIGGIDPCNLDRDPVGHLNILFDLAEKYSLPIDVHLHEPGDLGVFSLDLILERTRALDMRGAVTVSHCFCLGDAPAATRSRLIGEFADLDVALASVAPAVVTPLPLVELTEAGVRVGLGEDGQRDYWSPYGNADMLDRTWQLAFTNGFRRAELIEHCAAVATAGGAAVLDPSAPRLTSIMDRPGLRVGDTADLLLVPGDTVAAAVLDRSPDRTVLHRGRVVADGLALTD